MSRGAASWRLVKGRMLPLDRARLMAILNVTPDSFSDGGDLPTPQAASEAARRAITDGADMLDVGGESTRPGSARIDADEQIRRIVPAIRAIRDAGIGAPISVDTTLASVAQAALDAGADAINDVSAGREDPAMFALAAERGAGLILMHRLAPPGDDRYSDRYDAPPDYSNGGVVEVVRRFLEDRIDAAMKAGVDRAAIAIDPGLGFGKSVEQNFELIGAMDRFVETGLPVLGAASRKSFIGRVTGVEEPRLRVEGSIGAALAMHARGARLFRVHDVAAHARAFRAFEAATPAIGARR